MTDPIPRAGHLVFSPPADATVLILDTGEVLVVEPGREPRLVDPEGVDRPLTFPPMETKIEWGPTLSLPCSGGPPYYVYNRD
jgi:hypothetical protein